MYFSNQWKLSEKKINELLNRLYNETSSKYDDKYYIVSHDVKAAISFNQAKQWNGDHVGVPVRQDLFPFTSTNFPRR